MGIHKSFREILSEKMTKNGAFSEEKWPNFTRETPIKSYLGPVPVADLLLGNTDVSVAKRPNSSRETWFSLYQREYRRYVFEEITPEKPIVKRVWTTKELQALKLLISFGAEELSETSTTTDIKKAFRSLAKRYHPDTMASATEVVIRERTQQFILIHRSYKDLIESCDT